ncbi:MAG: patatin [Oscillatoriales cyanobacterium RM2_1_1]|nr:patatin [Oscillatoriales cyanobacterium SM2_3_0]NJO46856.1 patatin [Oscillatoriales cyanobacterium RM2_1_1]
MAKFTRILSIDGGGVRGLIPAQILIYVEQRLQQRTGNPRVRIVDYFDIIAGTSAGGILTALYLRPQHRNPDRPQFSAQEAANFFYKTADQIFSQTFWSKLLNIGGVFGEKYSARGLEKLSQNFFGDLKLSQLLKPCLITAYEIERRKAFFFTQHDAQLDSRQDFLVRDVIRSTTAAPTFFEVAQIKSLGNDVYTFIDGGVFANNPALCCYAEVRHKFNHYFNIDQRYESGPTAREMIILSLGTGDVKTGYPFELAKRWGKIRWLTPLFNIIMTGTAETVNYQLTQIYDAIENPPGYLRINPILRSQNIMAIDDTSQENLDAVVKLGREQAQQYQNRLDDFIELLLL